MQKVSSQTELAGMVRQWKEKGETIVFTNGVFDILHLGHVEYLEAARAFGDRLVVAINDDASVRRLNKGPERPINPEQARATVIRALRCVDAVTLFHDDTPLQIISQIVPDVLVKGGDYDPNEKDPSSKKYIVGSKEVLKNGGRVITIPTVEGYSTTSILSRLK